MFLARSFLSLTMLFVIGLFSSLLGEVERIKKPIDIVVIVPSYNNKKWCEKNLKSIFAQDYPYWKLVFIDDCSNDGMGAKVDKLVNESGLKERCTVIHNLVRVGGMANLYNATHNCRPDQVVVTVDGDDCLVDTNALSHVAEVYQDPRVWMTYGSYRCDPTGVMGICRKFPKHIMRKNQFRKYRWVSSHLRTYYAKLFQKIKKKDLMYQGKFFEVTQDLAIMFPILEMSSKGHIKYIKRLLYAYNVSNPISDIVAHQRLVFQMEREIRSRKPYHPLKRLFGK